MDLLTEPLVLTQRRGAVALVTPNRPTRLDAWTDAPEDSYFDALLAASIDHADQLVRTSFQRADLTEDAASFTERRLPAFSPLSHKEI